MLESASRERRHIRQKKYIKTFKMWLRYDIHFTDTEHFIWISRNISDEMRNQEELGRKEEKYRALAENSSDVIMRIDRDGRYLYVNQAIRTLLNKTPQDFIGKRSAEIDFHRMENRLWETGVQKVLHTGRPTSLQFELLRDGETGIFDCRIFPEFDGDGQVRTALASIRDITELKRVQEEKKNLEVQFLQAQKMEAIGRLAGGVAHDFNNLLTGITGNIALAMMDLDPEDPLFQNLQEIKWTAERTAELTHQLLAFSRKQIIAPKRVELNEVVARLENMLRRMIGEDVELRTRLQEGLGMVKVDPGQMEQVLVNLAVNARDAMPDGGKLTIETGEAFLDEDYCRRRAYTEPGRYAVLTISDNGVGMDGETLSHVFEPFYTTKPKDKGTGLGLATVYGIVKQNKGYVEVYSEQGLGATFRIYLPFAKTENVEDRKERRKEVWPRGEETILLVEDEKIVRETAARVLGHLGYRILVGADGDEGLAVARKWGSEIDLLMTDVVMPGISGAELVETLRKIRPEMKILFTSGYTEDVIVHHGVLEQGVNFIEKPYNPAGLARKIRDVLDA